MKRILIFILCSLSAFLASAQSGEYIDTMYLSIQGEQRYLYHIRTFEDGTQRGLLDGAFRIPVDSATAANYIAGQIWQVANDYWQRETARINAGTYTRKIIELDSLAIQQFGISARNVARDAAKPEILTYSAQEGQDTTFLWRWRILKTGAAGVDAQIVERFSTKVLRLIPAAGPGAGTEITFTVDNTNVFRCTYDGATRFFLRNPANPNEWQAFDVNRGVAYRLVRSVNARATAAFKAQNTAQ
jgi:hypothetical protein